MDEYRKYNVKVSEYKGMKKFHITNNFFDKSDYAFYKKDGQIISYSPYAVSFVKRCIKGVEDILDTAKTGHTYVIYTDGVHGNAVRYADISVRQKDKTDILNAVEKHKQTAGTSRKGKLRETKKKNDER